MHTPSACLAPFLLAASIAFAAPPDLDHYVVMVSPGADRSYMPAAEAMAVMHGGVVEEFDPANLDDALAILKRQKANWVVFVLPPSQIDVDLAHRILEMMTKIDDDLFVDAEYAFVTGRDGPAALKFVERTRAAWDREWGGKASLFGTWEGVMLPREEPQSACAAMGLDAEVHLVPMSEVPEKRTLLAQRALASFAGKDALLFFSHGYPTEMVGCFSAGALREWKVDLAPAILVNCACYNGAPGRWFEPAGRGSTDKGIVPANDSVALAILDSGVAAYFGGVDPWHGPLAMQVFQLVVDDGMRVGQASKAMYDRLALAFAPERIHYGPAKDYTFVGEGQAHRRTQGAAMIVYGDPAFAPFATRASRLASHSVAIGDDGGAKITITVKPQVKGNPSMVDFMVPQARWTDYYSVKSGDVMKELTMECRRAIPLPAGVENLTDLRITDATCGGQEIKVGAPVAMIEDGPTGRVLQVRIPIKDRLLGNQSAISLAQKGAEFVLEGKAVKATKKY